MNQLNENSKFTLPPSGKIFLPFNVEAAVSSLPVYSANEGQASVIETWINFLTDGNYQYITRACPTTQQEGGSNIILANQSFEDQISVPAGSFLTAIGGFAQAVGGSAGVVNNGLFRYELYDAGAQAPIFDGFVNGNTGTGRHIQNAQTGTGMRTFITGGKSLYILPSPLAISSPGQLNVKIVNLASYSVVIDMAFFFATPVGDFGGVNGAVIGNAVRR